VDRALSFELLTIKMFMVKGLMGPEDLLKFSKAAILAPKNDHCRAINDKVFDLIPEEVKTYTSINRLVSENDREILEFPIEFLDSPELIGLPPHELNLKLVRLLCCYAIWGC